MNLLNGRIKNYMIDFDYRGKNITNGIIDPDELERLQEELLDNVRNIDQIKIIQNRISNTKTIVQITVSQLWIRPVMPQKTGLNQ